jgi:hypothetical protein
MSFMETGYDWATFLNYSLYTGGNEYKIQQGSIQAGLQSIDRKGNYEKMQFWR